LSEVKRDAKDLLKAHGAPIRQVYLDSENSGLIFPEAIEDMVKCYTVFGYGHPSITHKVGWETYEVLMKSSEIISRALGCSSDEILYLHSGTEANNLAILGLAKAHGKSRRKIIVSSIEHLSVIHTVEDLVKYGFEIVKVPVDNEGFVDPDILSSNLDSNTLMVSIGFVNHEIGTIQDLKGLVEVVKDYDEGIFFHTDAVDALGRVKFSVKDLNVDLASFSSHKVFGPKGAACLYVKSGVNLEPIIFGQLSTQRFWPGLENVPSISGFARAVDIMISNFDDFNSRMSSFRDMLINGVLSTVDNCILNGPMGVKRASDNVNLSFLYCEGEALTVELSLRGIYVSSGSACTSRILQPSHILLAIGRRYEEAHGSILMKVTPFHTIDDIRYVLDNIPEAVNRIRSISPFKGD